MTEKMFLKMIEILIGALKENGICSYCSIFHNCDFRCKNEDLCADLIFDGVKNAARKSMEERINAIDRGTQENY